MLSDLEIAQNKMKPITEIAQSLGFLLMIRSLW